MSANEFRVRPSFAGLALGLALAVFLVTFGSACLRCGGEAAIEERLEDEGTMEVLEKAGEAEYDPPADGEVTEDQMQMYLAVQERAAAIRQVASKRLEEKQTEAEGDGKEMGFFDAVKAIGDVGDLVTADLRAAQELGHNTAEYQWVQGKVVEAQMARMTREMGRAAGAAGQQFVGVLEAQIATAQDPDQKAQLEQQLGEYKKGLAEAQTAGDGDDWGPGVDHNIELVEEYQDELQRVQRLQAGEGEEAGR